MSTKTLDCLDTRQALAEAMAPRGPHAVGVPIPAYAEEMLDHLGRAYGWVGVLNALFDQIREHDLHDLLARVQTCRQCGGTFVEGAHGTIAADDYDDRGWCTSLCADAWWDVQATHARKNGDPHVQHTD